MFNSIFKGDGEEQALAERWLPLDDCRTGKGQACSQLGSQVHLKCSSSPPRIVREEKGHCRLSPLELSLESRAMSYFVS